MRNIILTFIILFSNGCSSQDNKNYFDLGKQEMKNQNLEKAVEYLSIAIDKNQNKLHQIDNRTADIQDIHSAVDQQRDFGITRPT